MVEEGLVVGGEVAGVHEFLRDDGLVTRITELERPAHQADRVHRPACCSLQQASATMCVSVSSTPSMVWILEMTTSDKAFSSCTSMKLKMSGWPKQGCTCWTPAIVFRALTTSLVFPALTLTRM